MNKRIKCCGLFWNSSYNVSLKYSEIAVNIDYFVQAIIAILSYKTLIAILQPALVNIYQNSRVETFTCNVKRLP